MPPQLTGAGAPKAPLDEGGAVQVLELEAEPDRRRPPIETTVIKLNNLAQWASSGCVVPYLSVYFLHYAQGSRNELGIFMMIASIVGVFVNFLTSSLADRHQAHRAVYISMLTIAYVAYLIMLIPILITAGANYGATESALIATDQHDIAQASVGANETTTSSCTSTPAPTTNGSHETAHDGGRPEISAVEQQNVFWFYVIGICVAIGNMSSELNMTLSDSFAANAARSAKDSSGASFGSLRFFAALGWMTASASVLLTNQLRPDLPYLLPSWLLFLSVGAANMLLVLFWPDKRPFDLAEVDPVDGETKQVPAQPPERIFEARMGPSWRLAPCWPKGRPARFVELEDQGTLAANQVGGISVLGGRVHDFDSLSFKGELDEHALDYRPQPAVDVRRCSIAPIGKSYVCEQFVVRPATSRRRASQASAGREMPSERRQHFKYIARIEPANKANLSELRAAARQTEAARKLAAAEQLDRISLKLYLKILELIARRNRNMLRFMLLYVVFGFTISLNWVFLFPYLEELDKEKFRTLSAWVMISSYFSETLFYFVSARLTRLLSAANGLSFALLVFAARYACYLAFAGGRWPLELIVLVELTQSISKGWFECIYNESALEFALEAERCVPKLVELGLMPNTRPAIEKVRNSVKLTLFSLSSCCFDGIGIGLGSLLGGRLIDRHGFFSLWTTSVCLALAVSLLNVLLELLAFSGDSRAAGAAGAQAGQNNKGGQT